MKEDPSRKKATDFRRSGLRLLRMMGADARLLVPVLVLIVASIALSVTIPRLLGRATDLVYEGVTGGGAVDFGAVGRILLAALALAATSATMHRFRGWMAATIAHRTAFRLRERAAAKLGRLPLSHYDGHSRGEILSRITNDVDNIAETLQNGLGKVVYSLLTPLFVLVMMVWLSPLMTLVALLTVPVAALATARIGKRAQPHFVRKWDATGRLSGHIEEMYTGHALVRAFGRQDEAARTFTGHNDELYRASWRAQFVSGVIEPALTFVGHLNYVLVAVVGGLRVASGAMTIGEVQAFVQYTTQFNQPIAQMAALANTVQSGVASAERVFALLDAPEEPPDPPASSRPARFDGGRVSFEKVSFRYKPDEPLIEDLSLTVEPGRTVAIVGPTGAGKSTLVNLLMRFYDVTGGRITVDGVDTSALPRAELRRHIGMVLQDTWLHRGTIADNIAYGRDTAPRDAIVAAARAAHADRFIRTLPDGYDTVIGDEDEGGGLSAGEKQLVTIARAFLTDPGILILDEATSSVDTRTEMLVQRAMASLRRGRTAFVIAHRLSTIRDADHILVMEAGRIVEQGAHDDLITAGGAYARLHQAQLTHLPT